MADNAFDTRYQLRIAAHGKYEAFRSVARSKTRPTTFVRRSAFAKNEAALSRIVWHA
jgi:hypothetical protein